MGGMQPLPPPRSAADATATGAGRQSNGASMLLQCQTTLHRNQLLVADLQARLHAATVQLHHLSEANTGLNRALLARDEAAARRAHSPALRNASAALAAAPQVVAAPPSAPVESSLAPSSDKSRLRQLQTALHDSDPRAEALGLGVHNMLGLQLRKLSSSQLEALEAMLHTVLGKAQATRALKEASAFKQTDESANGQPTAPALPIQPSPKPAESTTRRSFAAALSAASLPTTAAAQADGTASPPRQAEAPQAQSAAPLSPEAVSQLAAPSSRQAEARTVRTPAAEPAAKAASDAAVPSGAGAAAAARAPVGTAGQSNPAPGARRDGERAAGRMAASGSASAPPPVPAAAVVKPPSVLDSARRTFGAGAGASWGDLED